MFIVIVLSAAITLIVIFKIYAVISHTNCKSKVCLVGKTALVTGGNSGIGYQIVLALAQRGCRVIIADKTQDQDLLENIFKETRSRNVVFKYVELSSFKSVRELAQSVVKDEERLDILINNAGMANFYHVTEDGFNVILQVNYLSAFLLTHLVLDLMKKTGGRIIFTSSVTLYLYHKPVENLKSQLAESINHFYYPNAKLCLVAASDIFAEKLGEYGITSNCYHPGLAATNIFRADKKVSTIFRFGVSLSKYLSVLVGKTAEEGAQTAIYLACANEAEGVSGGFFYETKPTFKPKLVCDRKIRQAIWERTEELVQLKQDERL